MNRATLMLALCAGCAAGDPAAGSGLLPGSRAPGAVPVDDAGADVLALAADAAPVLMPDVAPLALDAAPVFPSCAAIGYVENGPLDCDTGRRTRDQRYSCGVCGSAPPSQPCESRQAHPGDIPWLCVRVCSECQSIVRCTGTNMCTVVRVDDGGVL